MADLIFTIKTPAELKGVQDAITGFEQAKGKALAAAVPDMAGEFAAYHQQNVELVNGLIAALRYGKRDLAALRSRNTDSMLS